MPTFTSEVTATVDIEFEVFCLCGAGLCNQSTGGNGRRGSFVTVEPCQKCLRDACEKSAEEMREKMQEHIDKLEIELGQERYNLSA